MEKYITDERTGLKYELVGDYYLIAGDDDPKERPIGIWGQRHLRYLKQHRRAVYAELLTSGKLNDYLADLNEQAEDMFFRLVKELAEKESITETLKADNQMLWVQRMNSVRQTATEIVNHDLIYTSGKRKGFVLKSFRCFLIHFFHRKGSAVLTDKRQRIFGDGISISAVGG